MSPMVRDHLAALATMFGALAFCLVAFAGLRMVDAWTDRERDVVVECLVEQREATRYADEAVRVARTCVDLLAACHGMPVPVWDDDQCRE